MLLRLIHPRPGSLGDGFGIDLAKLGQTGTWQRYEMGGRWICRGEHQSGQDIGCRAGKLQGARERVSRGAREGCGLPQGARGLAQGPCERRLQGARGGGAKRRRRRRSRCRREGRETGKKQWCWRNGVSVVSTGIGVRVDVISHMRNRFFFFFLLFSR